MLILAGAGLAFRRVRSLASLISIAAGPAFRDGRRSLSGPRPREGEGGHRQGGVGPLPVDRLRLIP